MSSGGCPGPDEGGVGEFGDLDEERCLRAAFVCAERAGYRRLCLGRYHHQHPRGGRGNSDMEEAYLGVPILKDQVAGSTAGAVEDQRRVGWRVALAAIPLAVGPE